MASFTSLDAFNRSLLVISVFQIVTFVFTSILGLDMRRKYLSIIKLYKMIFSYCDIDGSRFYYIVGPSQTRSNHDFKIRSKAARTNCFKHSLLNRHTNNWNSSFAFFYVVNEYCFCQSPPFKLFAFLVTTITGFSLLVLLILIYIRRVAFEWELSFPLLLSCHPFVLFCCSFIKHQTLNTFTFS